LRLYQERVPKGTYDHIHDEVKKKRNLPTSFSFPYENCKKRIQRGAFKVSNLFGNNLSPLHDIEDHIVTLLMAMADSGNPITVGNALPLINSLIQGTSHQKKLIAWKRTHLLNFERDGTEKSEEELRMVGPGYWHLFMKRHKNLLQTNKGRLFELNHTKWTLYSNFRDMYVNVESHMVDAKVATKLDEPAWMDKDGNIVSEEESVGMKVQTKLTHPDCCLAMDETGGDTSMISDGAAGGEKYVGRKGQEVKRPAGKKAKKYTTIGLTGLDGNPAMCILIFAGKQRNILMEAGVDTSLFHSDDASLDLEGVHDDIQLFNDNYGEGKLFPGGPTCMYKGKEIPCMVRYSTSGGITPEILTDIVRTMDELGVFEKEREEGIRPFLLLDGHQSRFSIPFLEYITNRDHPWKVCIGVPYGTAIWQIGDSSHQNGRYKIRTGMKKKMILRKRISQMISEVEILPSDIIPIVNYAWNYSFADIKGNQKAIVQRGWCPLNRNLLLLDELRKTMTEEDYDWEEKCEIFPHKRYKKDCDAQQENSTVPTMRVRQSESLDSTSARPNLNISQGVAATAIEFLVGHNEQQSIRAECAKKRKAGQTVREGFERIKSLKASGQMIAATGDYEIGMNTLNEVHRRAALQKIADEEEKRIKEETHQNHVDRYNELLREKPVEEDWTKPDILTALRAVKKRGDRANPGRVGDLMTYWKELRSRIHPTAVQEVTSVTNTPNSHDVLTNATAVVPTKVGTTSETYFKEKEGNNETVGIAM
jgi:hypothetical protein